MKNTILKFLAAALILFGGLLTAFALMGLLGHLTHPSPDSFELVFVVGCGPMGLILLVPGIILSKKLKSKAP